MTFRELWLRYLRYTALFIVGAIYSGLFAASPVVGVVWGLVALITIHLLIQWAEDKPLKRKREMQPNYLAWTLEELQDEQQLEVIDMQHRHALDAAEMHYRHDSERMNWHARHELFTRENID